MKIIDFELFATSIHSIIEILIAIKEIDIISSHLKHPSPPTPIDLNNFDIWFENNSKCHSHHFIKKKKNKKKNFSYLKDKLSYLPIQNSPKITTTKKNKVIYRSLRDAKVYHLVRVL